MMSKRHNTRRPGILARLTFIMGFAQMVLILLSWMANVADTGIRVRSLLAADGIRWFFGTFADNVASAPLAWLVLLAVAVGAVMRSGLHAALRSRTAFRALSYRARHALWTSLTTALVMLLCVCLLTFVPHALLLGVTGSLWPSPFLSSLVPVAAFIITASAVVYGLQSGSLATADDVFSSLYYGIRLAAPLFPLYIIGIELFYSVSFVFGL